MEDSLHQPHAGGNPSARCTAYPADWYARIPTQRVLGLRNLSSLALLGYLVTNKGGFSPSRSRARSMGWGADRFYAALWDLADSGHIERPSLVSDPAERARVHRKGGHVAPATLRLTIDRPESDFVIVRRGLIKEVGFAGSGVLLYVQARGCRLYPREVAEHFGIAQRRAFQILNSLAAGGHLIKDDARRGGKFAGCNFRSLTARASPGVEKPDTASPDTASPDKHIKEESSSQFESSPQFESSNEGESSKEGGDARWAAVDRMLADKFWSPHVTRRSAREIVAEFGEYANPAIWEVACDAIRRTWRGVVDLGVIGSHLESASAPKLTTRKSSSPPRADLVKCTEVPVPVRPDNLTKRPRAAGFLSIKATLREDEVEYVVALISKFLAERPSDDPLMTPGGLYHAYEGHTVEEWESAISRVVKTTIKNSKIIDFNRAFDSSGWKNKHNDWSDI